MASRISSVIIVIALVATAWYASPQAQDTPPQSVNLIAAGRFMPTLNDQTFGDAPYIIPPPPPDALQFAYALKGYVFGIPIVRTDYYGYVSESHYALYSDVRTSGLGALLKKLEIWSVTHGRVLPDGGLRPIFSVQQNLDKKNRRVEMIYDDQAETVSLDIRPPNGSFGTPPATREQQYGSLDALSALVSVTLKGQAERDALCRETVAVFDSKQHYNLRLERIGTDEVKFLGGTQDAIHCHVYYEPVAGFDSEDLPSAEEAETPIQLYFDYDETADIHVPVRFTYKVSGFTAVVKMTDKVIIPPSEAR